MPDKNSLIQLIEEKLGIDYKGFIETIDNPAEYIGHRFLPVENTFDYNWFFDIFDNTTAMAKVMARAESETPIVGSAALKQVQGSIQGFGQKNKVDKNILNTIYNTSNEDLRSKKLKEILSAAGRHVRAAQMRREWLIWQPFTTGLVTIQEGEVKMIVDEKVPNGNKYDVGALTGDAWNGANPKPFSDYEMICDAYYLLNNFMPTHCIMRRAQVNQMLRSAEVKGLFTNNVTPSRVTLSVLNEYLNEQGLPQIEIYDAFARLEDVTGRPTSKQYFIPDGRICFLREAEQGLEDRIGNMLMGPVEENNFKPGIYVDMYEEKDPHLFWHYMKAEMWPAIFNPEQIAYAQVTS